MPRRMSHLITLAFLLLPGVFAMAQTPNDPYLWLESVDGVRPMEWVRAHNDSTTGVLAKDPLFRTLFDRNMEVFNAADRIPDPELHGTMVYNLWQDAEHERGIWRRASLIEYCGPEPAWEVVLDLDTLSRLEKTPWVFKSAQFLYPGNDICLLSLSRGGGDATVVREFDLRTKKFVDGGFSLPEAKSSVSWLDTNTIIVGTDFGAGSMTSAGYPRTARLWKRGTPLSSSTVIFEGDTSNAWVSGYTVHAGERQYFFVDQYTSFFTSNSFSMEKGKLVPVPVPHDAVTEVLGDQLIIWLKTDWKVGGKTFLQGSLLSTDFDDFLKGGHALQVIFAPTAKSNLNEVRVTRRHLLANVINNIRGELYEYSFVKGAWEKKKVAAPEYGTISLIDVNRESDEYFFGFSNFLTPQSVFLVTEKNPVPQKVKSRRAYFDASPLAVTQHEARSKDGTMIPYFLVARKDMAHNGATPVMMEGYGGFEISMLPYYAASRGYAWLERGGAYVLTNIRGGGEFGPAWHLSSMKENRQKVYDDFFAVAEDLIRLKVTSPKHLGIIGGSNGGLLVGAAFTQRPELFGAVVCEVPLLDMQRYSKLLAGASWMAEYGDPDKPEEWAYIKKYSPYHNVTKGKKYPRVLFMTSTRDDRVHPGHARKMAAKMEDLGYRVYYFENTEGGHGGSATNKQAAYMSALQWVYAHRQLQGKGSR
jgi:prolyl oligopeptidase